MVDTVIGAVVECEAAAHLEFKSRHLFVSQSLSSFDVTAGISP